MLTHLYPSQLLVLFMCSWLTTTALAEERVDSNSVYFKSKMFLSNGNHDLYKFGNIKPRDLEDAFCVFLTADDDRLLYFKNLDLPNATVFALKREHNLMRYDWGCESFRDFSKFMIVRYKLWAPDLQLKMAVQCFHVWMNYGEPNLDQMAKELRTAYKKLNKQWEKRFLVFTTYANNEHLKGKSKREYQRFLRKSRA